MKLYNTLGLRLLDTRNFEECLNMLRKAERLVDKEELWTADPGKR